MDESSVRDLNQTPLSYAVDEAFYAPKGTATLFQGINTICSALIFMLCHNHLRPGVAQGHSPLPRNGGASPTPLDNPHNCGHFEPLHDYGGKSGQAPQNPDRYTLSVADDMTRSRRRIIETSYPRVRLM
jgi:hypothetical protein